MENEHEKFAWCMTYDNMSKFENFNVELDYFCALLEDLQRKTLAITDDVDGGFIVEALLEVLVKEAHNHCDVCASIIENTIHYTKKKGGGGASEFYKLVSSL